MSTGEPARLHDEEDPSSEPKEEPSEAPTKSRAEEPRKSDEEEPPDARTDETISRNAPWWDAGGGVHSIVFWGSVLVFVVGLWRTTILPFVDYPQHLALAAILRRMMSAGAPERALFETNLFSYNSLFHIVVAGLNVVFKIDTAGKIVVAAYIVFTAYATLALLRATGRPRARAFLVLPVVVGYSIAWGFVNFGLGVAVQLIVLARVLDRRALSPKLALRRDVITALLAFFGAYTHLLATALVYMLMLVAIVVRTQTEKEPFFERIGRAIRTGIPLLPAIVYCFWVYRRQDTSAHKNYEYAVAEGNDVFGLVKIKEFLGYATGLRTDGLDAKILSIALGLLVLGALLRDPDDEPPSSLRWLFVASVLAYLIIPHVFWATNFVFERITFLVVITAILWAPRARPKFEAGLRLMYVSVGLAAAVCFWGAMTNARDEVKDLDAILAIAPKGRRVTGLVYDPRISSTLQWSMLHSPAYYVARNGGEVAFSFTRTMSLPVHYRPDKMPPDTPPNFEWNPGDYRASAEFAKYFDLILMKTTWDDGKDPRESVWGTHWQEVDTVAHIGRWWIFETKRVTADPPPSFDPPKFDDE